MNILHITPRLHIGGAEIVVKDLALLAKKAGLKVSILTFAEAKNHIVDEILAHEIPLIQLPHSSPYSPWSLAFFLKLLREQSYDVIHTHMPLRHKYLAIINYFLSQKLPLISTEHVDKYQTLSRGLLYKWIYGQYKKSVFCSHDMQDFILTHFPSLKSNSTVIHNGVELSKFESIKSSLTLHPKRPLQAISLARLDKQKDLVTCIHAFATIKSNIHLSIVGDGAQRVMLTKLIQQLNIGDKVTLLGWQSNIPLLLSQADLYVQSSVWEGFSIGILEAMAMGLPMIVSNAGALVEAVDNAGLIFSKGDVMQLANHLDYLAENPSFREELAQRSLDRVRQFSLDSMWSKYYKTYCELADVKQLESAL